VTDIAADPTYLDVMLEAGARFYNKITSDHTAFAYVYDGEGDFCGNNVTSTKLVIFGEGDGIDVVAEKTGVRFLLISGKPLGEPIARYGPFVMNTDEEIEQALKDLRDGTFVSP
jgi:redox-sensitive bicupin YhaK (pirin superfamily)